MILGVHEITALVKFDVTITLVGLRRRVDRAAETKRPLISLSFISVENPLLSEADSHSCNFLFCVLSFEITFY